MRAIARCVSMLMMCVFTASVASAAELGLITGAENGTYYQLGQDLKKLVKPSGINLTVYPSKGSVDNIFAVSQKHGIQLGIVQSDVLAFVADQAVSIAKSIRVVFPLHDEEVHVVGRRAIADFEQLSGKRVAIGSVGSGTYLTAQRLFKLAEVAPSEMVPIDAGEALAQLKAGRIDAMVYVVGHPVGLLKRQVKADDGLALIPISNKSILDAYAPVEIPADVYDWQTTAVSTVAVKAVLVAFDSRGPECESVGRFAQQLATGMEWLTKNGHPKWKRVDLDYPLKGWEQHECVRKYLGKRSGEGESPAASTAQPNPVADAIKGVLDRR